MKLITVLFFLASILAVQGGASKTQMEALQKWEDEKLECTSETKIDEEIVKKLFETRTVPDDDKVAEFLLCIEHKEGTITEAGAFDKDVIPKVFVENFGDELGNKLAAACPSEDHGNDGKANALHLYKCYFTNVSVKDESDAMI